MKKSIAKQLEELHHQIQSRDFVQEAHSTPEWGGADVIISSHMSDSYGIGWKMPHSL